MPGLGNRELYRMVLDSLPVAMCAVDRDGKVILWNDGARRVTGYLRQDVLGHLCTDAFLEHADTDNDPLEGNALPLLETMRDGKCLAARASLRKNRVAHKRQRVVVLQEFRVFRAIRCGPDD